MPVHSERSLHAPTRLRNLTLGTCLFAVSAGCSAASFSVACSQSSKETEFELCGVLLSGEIVAGDNDRYLALLTGWTDSEKRRLTPNLVLNSPGGDVFEAIKIAETVRKLLAETSNFELTEDKPFKQGLRMC